MERLKQKKLAQVHSVFGRYQDIVSATGAAVNSPNLFPYYQGQKAALEDAAAFLSLASHGRYFAAMMSEAESEDEARTEYFCSRTTQSWSQGTREMKAFKAALELWGADNLARKRIVCTTTSDELFSLMQFGHSASSVSDESKQGIRDIQNILAKHRIQATVISVTEVKLLRLACEAEEDNSEAKNKLVDFYRNIFPGGTPTKVQFRNRTADD